MSDKGAETRERILAAAEPLVLKQGFAGTSLHDILAVTGLTKGAFFHHFAGKSDFGRALVERYARNDLALFERFAAEAEAKSDDPLEQALHFLKALEDFIASLPEPIIGCVFASYVYEGMQFDATIHAYIAQSFRRWSAVYERKFEAVLARYRPARPVTARDLSETIMAIIEGGFILQRIFNDPLIIARLARQFRQYLEMLFADRAEHETRGRARG